MSKCDCCGEELSDNIRMNSSFNFGNGTGFCDGWSLCYDCGEDVNRYLKKVKKRLNSSIIWKGE